MPHAVLDFWFREIRPAAWWAADPAFDTLVAGRFGPLLEQALRCELFGWRATPDGRLAEVIVPGPVNTTAVGREGHPPGANQGASRRSH